jgi:ATP-dependent Lon protease
MQTPEIKIQALAQTLLVFQDLDADHYAMDKLKRRVLEYLAVRQLKNNLRGPILCFVGPPGVGKTSVGRSIAQTLGREFHRSVKFI